MVSMLIVGIVGITAIFRKSEVKLACETREIALRSSAFGKVSGGWRD